MLGLLIMLPMVLGWFIVETSGVFDDDEEAAFGDPIYPYEMNVTEFGMDSDEFENEAANDPSGGEDGFVQTFDFNKDEHRIEIHYPASELFDPLSTPEIVLEEIRASEAREGAQKSDLSIKFNGAQVAVIRAAYGEVEAEDIRMVAV